MQNTEGMLGIFYFDYHIYKMLGIDVIIATRPMFLFKCGCGDNLEESI